MRYNLTWYHNIVDQNRYAFDCMLDKLKSETDYYKDRMFNETFVDDNCMDFFYAEKDVYKSRITAMQEKLDKDTETMDTKLILKRIQIDKVLDQQKSLNDEIERFHKEEEEMRERLAKEEKEAEMKRIVSKDFILRTFHREQSCFSYYNRKKKRKRKKDWKRRQQKQRKNQLSQELSRGLSQVLNQKLSRGLSQVLNQVTSQVPSQVPSQESSQEPSQEPSQELNRKPNRLLKKLVKKGSNFKSEYHQENKDI